MATSSKNKHSKMTTKQISKNKEVNNSVVPNGYYLAESTPAEIVFTEPTVFNKNSKEVDLNNYIFFAVRKNAANVLEYEAVDDETLQQIMLNPNSPWEEKMKDMVIIGPSGNISAAVLPNLIDLNGRHHLHSLVKKLSAGKFQYIGDTKIVPKFLNKFIDPTPDIRFGGPIYSFGLRSTSLKICAYTDTVVVFRLAQPVSGIDVLCTKGYLFSDCGTRFHSISVAPRSSCVLGRDTCLNEGDVVIVWNGRHVARPSFAVNFEKLVQIHNPLAIVVTETRVSTMSFERVMEEIETDMGWGLSESIGLSGGIAILWEKARATTEYNAAPNDEVGLRMVATIKPGRKEDVIIDDNDDKECSLSEEF